MACACKRQLKEPKMNIKEAFKQKVGTFFIFKMIRDIILKILMKIFIVFLFLILTPLITIILLTTFVFTGKFQITLPTKLLKVISKLKKDE